MLDFSFLLDVAERAHGELRDQTQQSAMSRQCARSSARADKLYDSDESAVDDEMVVDVTEADRPITLSTDAHRRPRRSTLAELYMCEGESESEGIEDDGESETAVCVYILLNHQSQSAPAKMGTAELVQPMVRLNRILQADNPLEHLRKELVRAPAIARLCMNGKSILQVGVSISKNSNIRFIPGDDKAIEQWALPGPRAHRKKLYICVGAHSTSQTNGTESDPQPVPCRPSWRQVLEMHAGDEVRTREDVAATDESETREIEDEQEEEVTVAVIKGHSNEGAPSKVPQTTQWHTCQLIRADLRDVADLQLALEPSLQVAFGGRKKIRIIQTGQMVPGAGPSKFRTNEQVKAWAASRKMNKLYACIALLTESDDGNADGEGANTGRQRSTTYSFTREEFDHNSGAECKKKAKAHALTKATMQLSAENRLSLPGLSGAHMLEFKMAVARAADKENWDNGEGYVHLLWEDESGDPLPDVPLVYNFALPPMQDGVVNWGALTEP